MPATDDGPRIGAVLLSSTTSIGEHCRRGHILPMVAQLDRVKQHILFDFAIRLTCPPHSGRLFPNRVRPPQQAPYVRALDTGTKRAVLRAAQRVRLLAVFSARRGRRATWRDPFLSWDIYGMPAHRAATTTLARARPHSASDNGRPLDVLTNIIQSYSVSPRTRY